MLLVASRGQSYRRVHRSMGYIEPGLWGEGEERERGSANQDRAWARFMGEAPLEICVSCDLGGGVIVVLASLCPLEGEEWQETLEPC